MSKKIILSFVFLLLQCCNTALVFAQAAPTSTNSPYGVIYTHLHNLEADNYHPEAAARAFGPEIPVREGKKLAVQLKEILDGKGLFVNISLIPTDVDYKDSTKTERYNLFPSKLPSIYLEKRNNIWHYSLRTSADISSLHRAVYPEGSDWMLENFPAMGRHRVLGLETWQFIAPLIFIGAGLLLFLLINFLANFIVKNIAHSRFGTQISGLEAIPKLAKQLSLYIVFSIFIWYTPVLQLPTKLAYLLLQGLSVTRVIFGTLLVLQLVNIGLALIKRLSLKTENNLDEHLVPIVGHIINAVIMVFGFFRVLYLLDVNVTALVAGVSIGGLAFALAAQDTVKNLIGSIMIFADRPFQIGDAIKGGDLDGVVEEVGFRSTRIRTPDTSIITIPNGKISDLTINNMGVRTSRRFRTELLVHNTATADQVEQYIERIKKMMVLHPKSDDATTEVFLNELRDGAYMIVAITYIQVETSREENAVKHELLFETLRIAEGLGLEFQKR
jgi:MscS family membrane protein